MYYNLICIFICTPICTQKNYSCKKWVLQVTTLFTITLWGGLTWVEEGNHIVHHYPLAIKLGIRFYESKRE
jgi:hypothetical protein